MGLQLRGAKITWHAAVVDNIDHQFVPSSVITNYYGYISLDEARMYFPCSLLLHANITTSEYAKKDSERTRQRTKRAKWRRAASLKAEIVTKQGRGGEVSRYRASLHARKEHHHRRLSRDQ